MATLEEFMWLRKFFPQNMAGMAVMAFDASPLGFTTWISTWSHLATQRGSGDPGPDCFRVSSGYMVRQAKSDLIAAIDHGLIKTSYDYAAIESTLVPTMALPLGSHISLIHCWVKCWICMDMLDEMLGVPMVEKLRSA
jgi:hypothetical protein